MRVYVASSWRNRYQPAVVRLLSEEGYDVYDFRHPVPGDDGFQWSEIDPRWQDWTPEQFRAYLDDPTACSGFELDMNALRACDACVLVAPCGPSAHMELGWACGAGKRTIVFMPEACEPELMYRMVHGIAVSAYEMVQLLGDAGGGNDGER